MNKEYKFGDLRMLSPSFLALIIIISIITSVFTAGYTYSDVLAVSAESGNSSPTIIILDPGHGGEDCGAIGTDGSYEKDLNLAIAFEIGKRLDDKGYTVVYTRTEDKLLYKPEENVKGIRKISDLKNRAAVARSYPEGIFVSIHMNSFLQSKYHGLQVYYSTVNESSSTLADKIQMAVKDNVQPENNRKIKAGKGLYLMENIENRAVLVECGFLSNEEECKKLSEKEYQKLLSFAIVCGIIDYVENGR